MAFKGSYPLIFGTYKGETNMKLNLILAITFLIISTQIKGAVTDNGYYNMNGIQICRELVNNKTDNLPAGYSVCRVSVEKDLYGLAIFYRGELFKKNPIIFDEYRGQRMNNTITLGIKINDGKFYTFKMKTRMNYWKTPYAQVVLHNQKSYQNRYSQVVYPQKELKEGIAFFHEIDISDPKAIWDMEFYFIDELENYDSNFGKNYFATLPLK
jgi:hypothetical protein